FVLGELLRRGMTEEEIHNITKIDPLFINKLNNIIQLELQLVNNKNDQKLLKKAKENGFSDMQIARAWETNETEVYNLRLKLDLMPVYKEVDTRSEEHTSELQSRFDLVCRLLLEKKKVRI